MQTPQHPRLKTYHSPKQRVLGNQATPAPAWRPNGQTASGSNAGSKILLSRLPIDVAEDEVETLFARTVGPVKEVFMVYNAQGKSRGIAVVTFTRAEDALNARAKYNGKIVDARRPIKIEIVIDEDNPRQVAPAPPPQPSLLARLAPIFAPQPNGQRPAQAHTNANVNPNTKAAPAQTPAHAPKTRLVARTRKGPRRVKAKRQLQQQQQQQHPQTQRQKKPKTAEDLDREMDDYRAGGGGGMLG